MFPVMCPGVQFIQEEPGALPRIPLEGEECMCLTLALFGDGDVGHSVAWSSEPLCDSFCDAPKRPKSCVGKYPGTA